MLHILENDLVKACIDDFGAEIKSVIGKKTNTEYMWQGDKAYWGGTAPILFPICGRLFDGKYTHQGKEYEMKIHGFARHSQFVVLEKSNDKLLLELTSNSSTKLQYPFEFRLRLLFTLTGNVLKENYIVFNDFEDVLPFCVGAHPGFNVPFNKDTCYDDYYLEFSNQTPNKKLVLSSSFLSTDEYVDYVFKDNILPLKKHMFDNETYFFKSKKCSVTIKSKKVKQSLTVSYDDMLLLGLWHQEGLECPFICIEPWAGIPSTEGKVDDIMTKQAMVHLPKNQNYTAGFSIAINED